MSANRASMTFEEIVGPDLAQYGHDRYPSLMGDPSTYGVRLTDHMALIYLHWVRLRALSLRKPPRMTVAQLGGKLGLKERATQGVLRRLREAGLLETTVTASGFTYSLDGLYAYEAVIQARRREEREMVAHPDAPCGAPRCTVVAHPDAPYNQINANQITLNQNEGKKEAHLHENGSCECGEEPEPTSREILAYDNLVATGCWPADRRRSLGLLRSLTTRRPDVDIAIVAEYALSSDCLSTADDPVRAFRGLVERWEDLNADDHAPEARVCATTPSLPATEPKSRDAGTSDAAEQPRVSEDLTLCAAAEEEDDMSTCKVQPMTTERLREIAVGVAHYLDGHDGCARISELCEHLGVDSRAVATVVEALVRHGVCASGCYCGHEVACVPEAKERLAEEHRLWMRQLAEAAKSDASAHRRATALSTFAASPRLGELCRQVHQLAVERGGVDVAAAARAVGRSAEAVKQAGKLLADIGCATIVHGQQPTVRATSPLPEEIAEDAA